MTGIDGEASLTFVFVIGCTISSTSTSLYKCDAWNGPKISSGTVLRWRKYSDSWNRALMVAGGPLLVTVSLLLELI